MKYEVCPGRLPAIVGPHCRVPGGAYAFPAAGPTERPGRRWMAFGKKTGVVGVVYTSPHPVAQPSLLTGPLVDPP